MTRRSGRSSTSMPSPIRLAEAYNKIRSKQLAEWNITSSEKTMYHCHTVFTEQRKNYAILMFTPCSPNDEKKFQEKSHNNRLTNLKTLCHDYFYWVKKSCTVFPWCWIKNVKKVRERTEVGAFLFHSRPRWIPVGPVCESRRKWLGSTITGHPSVVRAGCRWEKNWKLWVNFFWRIIQHVPYHWIGQNKSFAFCCIPEHSNVHWWNLEAPA